MKQWKKPVLALLAATTVLAGQLGLNTQPAQATTKVALSEVKYGAMVGAIVTVPTYLNDCVKWTTQSTFTTPTLGAVVATSITEEITLSFTGINVSYGHMSAGFGTVSSTKTVVKTQAFYLAQSGTACPGGFWLTGGVVNDSTAVYKGHDYYTLVGV